MKEVVRALAAQSFPVQITCTRAVCCNSLPNKKGASLAPSPFAAGSVCPARNSTLIQVPDFFIFPPPLPALSTTRPQPSTIPQRPLFSRRHRSQQNTLRISPFKKSRYSDTHSQDGKPKTDDVVTALARLFCSACYGGWRKQCTANADQQSQNGTNNHEHDALRPSLSNLPTAETTYQRLFGGPAGRAERIRGRCAVPATSCGCNLRRAVHDANMSCHHRFSLSISSTPALLLRPRSTSSRYDCPPYDHHHSHRRRHTMPLPRHQRRCCCRSRSLPIRRHVLTRRPFPDSGPRSSLLLHGRQVPRLLHHHHRLLARTDRRHLPGLHHGALPTHRWQGPSHRGLLVPPEVDVWFLRTSLFLFLDGCLRQDTKSNTLVGRARSDIGQVQGH